jgi:hypothetical protein
MTRPNDDLFQHMVGVARTQGRAMTQDHDDRDLLGLGWDTILTLEDARPTDDRQSQEPHAPLDLALQNITSDSAVVQQAIEQATDVNQLMVIHGHAMVCTSRFDDLCKLALARADKLS